MTPDDSDNLTSVIVPEGNAFVVFESSKNAEHHPDYRELIRTKTRADAELFLINRIP